MFRQEMVSFSYCGIFLFLANYAFSLAKFLDHGKYAGVKDLTKCMSGPLIQV